MNPARFPEDDRLRDHGFRLECRPEHGEPIWRLNGRLYPQSRALELCDQKDRMKLFAPEVKV